jgi:hypothetical protein
VALSNQTRGHCSASGLRSTWRSGAAWRVTRAVAALVRPRAARRKGVAGAMFWAREGVGRLVEVDTGLRVLMESPALVKIDNRKSQRRVRESHDWFWLVTVRGGGDVGR